MNIKEKTQEILVQNGLDFTISKRPTAYVMGERSIDENGNVTLGDGGQLINSPYFVLRNDKNGKVIHTVKDSYTISQNDEIVEKVLLGLQPFGEDLKVTKAHSINYGAKVILQVGINGLSKVGNDNVERFITIIDSNDGSTSLSIGVGDLVFRCMNQFYRFYKSGHRFRHSASITAQIEKFPFMIEEALGQSLKQIEFYNKFQSTPVTRELAHKLVNALLGVDRTASQKELAELSTRAKNAMDTLYGDIETEFNEVGVNAWGLFGGVTRWTTHHKSVPLRENGRIESLVTGTNYATNQKAFDFVAELVG